MAIKRAAANPTHTPVPRRAASVVTAFAMIAAGLGIAAGLQLASAASGTIGGVVFHDYDADGAIDGREPGVGGVQVVAIDGEGNRTNPAISESDGSYTIGLEDAAGDALGVVPTESSSRAGPPIFASRRSARTTVRRSSSWSATRATCPSA